LKHSSSRPTTPSSGSAVEQAALHARPSPEEVFARKKLALRGPRLHRLHPLFASSAVTYYPSGAIPSTEHRCMTKPVPPVSRPAHLLGCNDLATTSSGADGRTSSMSMANVGRRVTTPAVGLGCCWAPPRVSGRSPASGWLRRREDSMTDMRRRNVKSGSRPN